MRSLVRPLASLLLLAWSTPLMVSAQPTPAPSASASPSGSAPAGAPNDEAQRRYNRALELFNEGSYDAALLEFRRAYELAPSWRILYNIAQVNVQLNDYAHALDAFERYLGEGGKDVSAARMTEVQSQIERLRGRVATLDIVVNVAGAEILVDDLPIGKSPLPKPIVVNAGRRKVTVSARDYLPQTRVIEATGGDKPRIQIELVSSQVTVVPTTSATGPVSTAPPPPERHVFWPGFIAAGALGAGAVVTGVLSLKATSDYEKKLDQFGVSPAELRDSRQSSQRLSIATDVLTGAALLTGGISIYLSLRLQAPETKVGVNSLGVRVGPQSLSVNGSF